MTLEDAYKTFSANLDFNEGQKQQIHDRRARLIGLLQQIWAPAKVLPIGSWARGTAIPPLEDIDIMIALTGVTPDQRAPSVLLDDFESRLRPHYAAVPTRKQTRSIGLRFEDFAFDIVPALHKPAGGYHIPDLVDPRRWIFTNPDKHIELAAEKNRLSGGVATAIVRMLKAWNANNRVGLKSFHLEVMVLRAMKPAPLRLTQAVLDAFESLARDVSGVCGDPGGSDNRLDTYLPTERAPLAQRLSDAARRLREAERTQSQAMARDVFGSPFP